VQADPQRRASFVVHSAIASFYHKSFPALGSASQGVSLKSKSRIEYHYKVVGLVVFHKERKGIINVH